MKPKYASTTVEGEIPTNYEVWTGRIIGLREGGFSYHAIAACVQWNSSTVMRVWKQGTDKHRTARKTSSGRRKVTSEHDNRHLLQMTVNDGTASSSELAVHWSPATGVLMSDLTIYRRLLHSALRARMLLYRIPQAGNHRRMDLQWAHEYRAWQADWYQVVYSGELHFNLWDHNGCVHLRMNATGQLWQSTLPSRVHYRTT